MRIYWFSLLFMVLNKGFGLLVGQKKQFEDVSLGSKKLWWAFFKFFFTIFVIFYTKRLIVENNQQINPSWKYSGVAFFWQSGRYKTKVTQTVSAIASFRKEMKVIWSQLISVVSLFCWTLTTFLYFAECSDLEIPEAP